jgi:heme-degrading monooxygenase HmoA
MIAVIFEVTPNADRADDYFSHATQLKSTLESMDGFVSVERFESVTQPGKFLSLSFWRDEDAVKAWRNQADHRTTQRTGRAAIFADYRLRVASVIRDYGMFERDEAPDDSQHYHR